MDIYLKFDESEKENFSAAIKNRLKILRKEGNEESVGSHKHHGNVTERDFPGSTSTCR